MLRGDRGGANALHLRLELQADCLAGVWAALNDPAKKAAIAAIDINAVAEFGSGTLRHSSPGPVLADAFTHGSSEQRVRWFNKGINSGRIQACDTFGATEL
jgi:predicted metalloprotease